MKNLNLQGIYIKLDVLDGDRSSKGKLNIL